MAHYSVNKYFGHFWQRWDIEADTEDEAWNMAERNGMLQYQSAYEEAQDKYSKGYIVCLDEKSDECQPIRSEQYFEWMREAINKGMVCCPGEYEKATGLPFVDVWI